MTRAPARWPIAPGVVTLGLLMVMLLPFVIYAARFGVRGLSSDLSAETYLYTAERWLPNLSLFSHMLGGAVITALAPLQLYTGLRGRLVRTHRWAGRLIVLLSLASALGGPAFIATRGTIGGQLMDVGFAIYGLCVTLAAVQTIRHGRGGDLRLHREWALRLIGGEPGTEGYMPPRPKGQRRRTHEAKLEPIFGLKEQANAAFGSWFSRKFPGAPLDDLFR